MSTGGGPQPPQVIFESKGAKRIGVGPQTYAFATSDWQPVPKRDLFVGLMGTLFPIHARLNALSDLPPGFVGAQTDFGLIGAPYEAHLFDIDVEEMFVLRARTAAALFWSGDVDAWDATLPATAGTIQSPGSTPSELHLLPTDFNNPMKTGTTLRSAFLAQAGSCSAPDVLDDETFFKPLDQQLRDALFIRDGGACVTPPIQTARLNYDNFTAFIAHEPGVTNDLRGGFLINLSARVTMSRALLDKVALILLQPPPKKGDAECQVDATTAYRFGLDDLGVLKVETSFGLGQNGTDSDGHPFPSVFDHPSTHTCDGVHLLNLVKFDGFATQLAAALSTTIPQRIHDEALQKQMFPRLDAPVMPLGFNCDPAKGNPELTCPADSSEQCNTAANLLSSLAEQVAVDYGMPSSDAKTLAATLTQKDNTGHLRRWRCLERGDVTKDGSNLSCRNPHRGRCEFIVPIKRLIPKANGVEPGLFDRLDEPQNAALALFYASLAPTGTTDFTQTNYKELCARDFNVPLLSRGVDIGNFYQTRWANRHGKAEACPPLPPLPPPGPPPTQCVNFQCPVGQTCNSLLNLCEDCLSGPDCFNPHQCFRLPPSATDVLGRCTCTGAACP